MTRSIPPWLPDGTAELLDDVVGEVSEYIQSRHHLVIVEGFRRSLAEEKDTLEHVNCGRADPGLKGSRFLLQVIFIFIFVLGLVILSRRVSSSESMPLSRQACQCRSRASN